MSRLARGLAVMLALAPGLSSARDLRSRPVYCWRQPDGSWILNQFKPLIDPRSETTFTESSFAGDGLAEMRWRRFFPDSELSFEYSFDGSGRLVALHGSIQVRSTPPADVATTEPLELADWVAEADLLPDEQGRIPPHHVLYTREKDRIEKPERAEAYVARFDSAPIYRTAAAVPCATELQQYWRAERTDVSQK